VEGEFGLVELRLDGRHELVGLVHRPTPLLIGW
jgi:hypothetical protein